MVDIQQKWIALLGRQDKPTDGVEDYCTFLDKALKQHGVELIRMRVPWVEEGWAKALRQLRRECRGWEGKWVLLQYTALAWSRRGFPLLALAVSKTLRRGGARVAVVFHDVAPFTGSRLRDKVRSKVQTWVMRRLVRTSALSIAALPTDQMDWVQVEPMREKFVVIPIGSNVLERRRVVSGSRGGVRTVVVFTVTEGRKDEAVCLARIATKVAGSLGLIRLVVIGRGALEAEAPLRESLDGAAVELVVRGILSPDDISDFLGHADVQLCVRTGISARRGSIVAGICAGLPVVGWSDRDMAFPITEAGIRGVPVGDEGRLIQELVAVLTDDVLRASLEVRSRSAAKRFFAWSAIAERFCFALRESSQGNLSTNHERPQV